VALKVDEPADTRERLGRQTEEGGVLYELRPGGIYCRADYLHFEDIEMERFEHLTTLSGLIHWQDRAKKGDAAIMALAHVRADVRDHIDGAAKDISAVEREGFLILTKLRNPMRTSHAPISSKIVHTMSAGTFKVAKSHRALHSNAKKSHGALRSNAAKLLDAFPRATAAAPKAGPRIDENKMRVGREWAELVTMLSPYQDYSWIAANRYQLKVVTRYSEQRRLQSQLCTNPQSNQ
jgi:hypothetical protein